MFVRDQGMIEAFAKQSPKNTESVAVFVIASIRTQLVTLPRIMKTYRKRGRNGLAELMPKQREGILYVRKNRDWLYNLVENYRNGGISTEQVLLELQRIPCIGLVKAGFMLQCLTGKVGCLDCHNLKEYGYKEGSFKLSHNKHTEGNLRKVRNYVETCEEIGGSEFLWNQWCEGMANRYPKHFSNADAVSFLHTDAILGIN